MNIKCCHVAYRLGGMAFCNNNYIVGPTEKLQQRSRHAIGDGNE